MKEYPLPIPLTDICSKTKGVHRLSVLISRIDNSHMISYIKYLSIG